MGLFGFHNYYRFIKKYFIVPFEVVYFNNINRVVSRLVYSEL